MHSHSELLGEALAPALDEMKDHGHSLEGPTLPGEMKAYWGGWWDCPGRGEGKEEGPGTDM